MLVGRVLGDAYAVGEDADDFQQPIAEGGMDDMVGLRPAVQITETRLHPTLGGGIDMFLSRVAVAFDLRLNL